jgi:hypothetical protein
MSFTSAQPVQRRSSAAQQVARQPSAAESALTRAPAARQSARHCPVRRVALRHDRGRSSRSGCSDSYRRHVRCLIGGAPLDHRLDGEIGLPSHSRPHRAQRDMRLLRVFLIQGSLSETVASGWVSIGASARAYISILLPLSQARAAHPGSRRADLHSTPGHCMSAVSRSTHSSPQRYLVGVTATSSGHAGGRDPASASRQHLAATFSLRDGKPYGSRR